MILKITDKLMIIITIPITFTSMVIVEIQVATILLNKFIDIHLSKWFIWITTIRSIFRNNYRFQLTHQFWFY